jgi:hypothetical protein
MARILGRILVFALGLSAASAEYAGQNAPVTPAEQCEALRKEYDIATGSGVPLTDAERLKFVGRVYKHHYAVAAKFLELAEKHPNEALARAPGSPRHDN